MKLAPVLTKPGQSRQKFSGCFKSFYHLVPSPVGDTQLYHPLGMGLGDKNPSNTQTKIVDLC